MNTPEQGNVHLRRALLVVGSITGVLLLCGFGVASFFRLGTEADALRASLMRDSRGEWQKKVGIHVGFFTTALVRGGSSFFKLPPEAKAAISGLRGAEVAVYKRAVDLDEAKRGALLSSADETMTRRGWERVVAVCKDGKLVAIYTPRSGGRPSKVKFCIAVLDERNLVVVGVQGNLEPMLALANRAIALKPG
jgi:hypothetical protein